MNLDMNITFPPQVSAEDMFDLILEENKNSLRDQLWKFQLEDFDEDDAKSLLKLVWAVNMAGKLRDIL